MRPPCPLKSHSLPLPSFPQAKNCSWSAEEDDTLVQAHRRFGNKWTEISKVRCCVCGDIKGSRRLTGGGVMTCMVGRTV